MRLSSVSIGYGGRSIATGLEAQLQAGELVCLIGCNGIGKSTLLRTMAGFMPPISGSVMLSGDAVHAMSPVERARKISVVLTERVNAQNMTVFDLVSIGRSPYTGFFGHLTSNDRRVVLDALRMVGMSDFENRTVDSLSDGERQKIMIAKALAQQTPVILLDEPTAFLDYPSKRETLELLRTLCREHSRAILVSTHDLDVALRIADRVWLMQREGGRGGATLRVGTPHELHGDIMKFMSSAS